MTLPQLKNSTGSDVKPAIKNYYASNAVVVFKGWLKNFLDAKVFLSVKLMITSIQNFFKLD